MSFADKQIVANLVIAQIAGRPITNDQLQDLIKATFETVSTLGEEPAAVVVGRPEPAVSIKASVKPDAVTCLDCGFKGKTLKRHLAAAHSLSPEQYRAHWGLVASHPLIAPNYVEQRRSIAVKIGLGRKG